MQVSGLLGPGGEITVCGADARPVSLAATNFHYFNGVQYFILLLFLIGGSALLAQQPYNIVWITAEDLSPRLGAYGDSVAQTPHLDRLARQSVRYDRAFANYGVCAPARHTLITGMYPTSTGAMAMRTYKRTGALESITDPELLAIPVYEATPPAGVKCFTEYLRTAGYFCTNNAKTDYQFRNPITAWDHSDHGAHYRQRPTPETPFFAVFNSTQTHESRLFEPHSPQVTDPATVYVPPYYPDTDTVRQAIARQYDNLHALDRWVGELLAELEADSLLDRTIVFFFSDHGDGLPRAKRWVYDSGTRVPLLIRWPDGHGAGSVDTSLVSFVDFAPTVLALAGVERPEYLQGRVFAGQEASQPPASYVYTFRDRMDPAPETIRAVRDHRFQYVRNYRPELPYLGYIPYRDRLPMMQQLQTRRRAGTLDAMQWQFWATSKPLEELYDLRADPDQVHNLAAEPRYFSKLAELRRAQLDFRDRYGDLGMLPESELIKMLWPPEGVQPITATPTIHQASDGQLTLSCRSEGASIAYRWGKADRWELYHQPLLLHDGMVLEARAIRLGWRESESLIYRAE